MDITKFPTREEILCRWTEEAIEKWTPTGMLEGSKEHIRTLACALENQRQWNLQTYEYGRVTSCKRVVVPIVKRVIDALAKSKVKVTADVTNRFGQYNVIDPNLKFDLYDESHRVKWEASYYRLDYECEWTLEMTEKIVKVLTREYKSVHFKALWYLEKCDTLVLYGDLLKEDPIQVCERKV